MGTSLNGPLRDTGSRAQRVIQSPYAGRVLPLRLDAPMAEDAGSTDRADQPLEFLSPEQYRARGGAANLFTLRAWLQAEQALEAGYGLDETVNFMQDQVTAIFGSSALALFNSFLEQKGFDRDGVGRLLEDEQALQALLDFLLAPSETQDPLVENYEWQAGGPGSDRRPVRRASRSRRANAILALVTPRRRRIAGHRAGPSDCP
jgi:hypothetical protein